MKIAVTCASGQLGSAIVNALKKQTNITLIAVARSPRNAAKLNIETRAGDYNKKDECLTAFASVDTVLLVSGMAPPQERILQHRNVIDAAKEAGVKRMIYTGITVKASGTGFKEIQQVSLDTEEYLKQSGMRWSIGRNGIYIEPDLDSIPTYVEQGEIANCASDGKCPYTSRAELAEAYAKMLINSQYDKQTYNLVGQPITQEELCKNINDVFGTKLSYRSMSVEEYRQERSKTLGDFLGPIITGIYEGIRNGAMDIRSDFSKVTGREHLSPKEMMLAYQTYQKTPSK